MDLALFDFDGTITTKGTYPDFLRMVTRPQRKIVGGTLLSPLIVGYKSGLVSDATIRVALSWASFWREDADRVRSAGRRFAAEVIPGLIRPVALERLAWHRDRGDRIAIVSASLDVYLDPWCRTLGVDVICTQLEERNGVLNGRYAGGDCCGEEKPRRIRARYDLSRFNEIYAYGDTEEDHPMLALAHRRFFRWEEVGDRYVDTRISDVRL